MLFPCCAGLLANAADLVDWYAAASVDLPAQAGDGPGSGPWFTDLRATAGVPDQRSLGFAWTFTSRLEYQLRGP